MAPSYEPGYPVLTYNNVLIESAGDERTVYLPRYGFRALDEAASKVWSDLGLGVFGRSAALRSAPCIEVRCGAV